PPEHTLPVEDHGAPPGDPCRSSEAPEPSWIAYTGHDLGARSAVNGRRLVVSSFRSSLTGGRRPTASPVDICARFIAAPPSRRRNRRPRRGARTNRGPPGKGSRAR